MKIEFFESLKQKILNVAWVFLLLALPITSFPLLPAEFGGTASVRPLSMLPLLVLLCLFTIPYIWKRPLPEVFLPFIIFSLICLASAFLAGLLLTENLRGVSPIIRSLRGLITLAVGAAFFFTISLYPSSLKQLNHSLRFIYIGFCFALLWGTIQITYILKLAPQMYSWVSQVQRLISSRKLMLRRISGLTYEPKWFAEQLCFILIPYLLASVLSGYSVFRWRYKNWSVEFFLLIWASVVLLFTYSRSGYFVLLLLIIVGSWCYRKDLVQKIKHFATKNKITTVKGIIIVIFCLVLLGVFIFWVGGQNNYFSRLWNYWLQEEEQSGDYLEYIAFRQRFVYAETALRIFESYPLLGVGLGNYAFYFADKLPYQSWHRMPDILRQLSHEEGREKLITPKNLYLKIIAETGMLGFAFFVVFICVVLGNVFTLALKANQTNDIANKFYATAGFFGFLAFLVFAFSYDSLANPNMWVVFGLSTAAWLMSSNLTQCKEN